MSEDKKLNLGLLSLVGEEAKPSSLQKSDPRLSESIAWVEQELKRGVLPKSLLAERLISIAPGLKQHEVAIQARIEALVKEIRALLPEIDREKFDQRFTESTLAAVTTQTVVEEKTWTVGGANEKVESWNRFASMVKETSEKRAAEVMPMPEAPKVNYRKPAAAIVFILLLVCSVFLLRKGTVADAHESFKFARAPLVRSIGSISEDSLALPTLDPLVQVSSLSSLVSEMNSLPQPAANEKVQRVRTAQAPLAAARADDRLEEIPRPEPKVKEALSIEQRDEPAALRDIQIQPEAALKENTFEFPPFINQKPEPTPDAVYADVRDKQGGRAVIHYSRPRRYAITAATQVMARPSYWAPRLGDKDPGDWVEVDAVIGVWLRIRDDFDGTGYILAQDAVPSR